MDKVQHFEIPADDLIRAKKFYGEVFNWKLVDAPGMPNYVMAYTTEVDAAHMAKEPNVINGGITKRESIAPAPLVAVTVDSIESALVKVKAAGGSVLSEIRKVGDMGLYAYVKDTEDNVVGVWQNLKTP